ncbi:unconventional myosin-XVIIIa isoform X1 [Vespula maculifrons]|uniref:Unconventional myosin-XVIIIa isoform X1 n=1 Tax=Vespula maculifrons TaxID=7453 RepID=A0ABD2APV9_VESMC
MPRRNEDEVDKDDSPLRAHYVLHRSCRGKAHASGIAKQTNNRRMILPHPEKVTERTNKAREELTTNPRNGFLQKHSRNSTSSWDCSDSDSMNSLEVVQNRIPNSNKNSTKIIPKNRTFSQGSSTHSSCLSRNTIGSSSKKKRESWADTLRGGLVDDKIRRMEEGWDDSNIIEMPKERKWRRITAEIEQKLPNGAEIFGLRGGSNTTAKNRINHSTKKLLKRNRGSVVQRPTKPIYDVVEWEELLEMALAKKMARGGRREYRKENGKKGSEERRETEDCLKRLEVLLQNRMTPLNVEDYNITETPSAFTDPIKMKLTGRNQSRIQTQKQSEHIIRSNFIMKVPKLVVLLRDLILILEDDGDRSILADQCACGCNVSSRGRSARSEEHLAQEQAWLTSERIWLLHRAGFTPAMRCGSADPDTGKLRICLTTSGEELLVDEEDVEKANPPQFDKAEELSQLRFLNESSVLHILRQRYASNLIHTYAGDSMLVINPVAPLAIYSEKVAHMFRGCKSEDMPPHIYAMAQSAYRGMLATRRDHSLVFLGRSGAGKTTNFKHALHYLVLAAGTVNKILTIEKLNALFTVLEAFGNSRTHMNSNATRFTQLFSLDFDQSGQIASASLQVLLLEKSRIGRRANGDPTFHAIYRLLAGAEGALRKELHLTNLVAENNQFVTPLQKHEDKQRAMVEFNRIVAAFRILGVSETDEKVIWLVLAGIYHLSCASAVKAGTTSQSRWQFARVECAEKAANLLGTSVEELSRIVFSSNGGGAGTPNTPRPALRTPSPTEQSKDVTGLDALEGLLIGLYSEVFHCVAALINKSISSSVHTVSSLLLCDSPGFQNPASCGRQTGACFEDLCHNYLQERLQLLFHHTTLVAPKDRYVQEAIDVDYEDDYDEDGVGSPQGLVSLLDRGSSQSATMLRTSQSDLSGSRQMERKGLLWLLDEETVCPGGSDETFLDRLFSYYGDRDHQMLLRKAPGNNQFVLQHLLGTNPVLYTATGWLKATRENSVAKSAIAILQESSREDVSMLFVSARGAGVSGALCGSMPGLEGSQSLRRASSIRRTFTAVKRKNVCLQVKFTVDGLIETLRRTRLKFIHCLLPQHNAGCTDNKSLLSVKSNQNEDSVINVPLLRSQIRGSQIIDAVRLHKVGFPKYMALGEFRRRFALLSSDVNARPGSPVADERRAVEDMLLTVDIDPASYRVGQSQVNELSFHLASVKQLAAVCKRIPVLLERPPM